MDGLTHFNEQGRARMVDVTDKAATHREALAQTRVKMNQETAHRVRNGMVEKGDVLAVAQVAGIMAAKKTSEWIPMCHPLPLSGVDIQFDWEETALVIQAKVKTKAATGVEMEALTAAAACALTVYDMCKAMDKGMVIGETFLVSKTGGKSGDYFRDVTT
jgi:cyclic pyranopterin phosphate synthase